MTMIETTQKQGTKLTSYAHLRSHPSGHKGKGSLAHGRSGDRDPPTLSSPLQPRPLRGTNHPTSLSVCGPFSPPPGPGTHSISPSLGTAGPDLFVATRMTHSLLRPYRAPPQCSPGDPPPAARLSPRPHSLCSPAPTFPLWFSLVFDPSKPFDPKKRGMRAGGLPGSWRLPGSKTAGDWAELALSSGPTWSAVHSRRS